MKKGFALLPVILLVIVVASIAVGAFYVGTVSQKNNKVTINQLQTVTPVTSSQTASSTQTQTPLFSGKVNKLGENLGLFKITDADRENGVLASIVYYEAGTFLRGDFAGYTRILAIRPSEGPGPSMQFLIATKDRKKYLLDDPELKTQKYPVTDYDNPYLYLDSAKVEKAVTLDSEHPQTITLESPFALYKREGALLESVTSGKKSKDGYDIYIEKPITEFEKQLSLKSPVPALKLFAGGVDWGKGEGLSDKEKKFYAIRNQYLTSTSLIHAPDSTGLTYSYTTTTTPQITAYESKLKQFNLALVEYKKQVELYNQKKLKEYPVYPQYTPLPGLRFTNGEIGLGGNFFETYDTSFPGACGGNVSTDATSNITDSDLESVKSQSVFSLFTLKNPKHPLNELAYYIKTSQDDEAYKGVNDGKSKPTFEAYVAKHPLIFFKDAFGRWLVLGEWDIKLMGGCGKPVIYLYPKQPTQVHISFTTPVALNTQIPTYHDGWNVLADPDGTLEDLQPKYTDCSLLDKTKTGSEYAPRACLTNKYPYIYWSGKSLYGTYPQTEGGWVVEKNNVGKFLTEKLEKAGLTPSESKDMTDYWVPEMMKKDMPYYRISFVQTDQMNDFIPMTVNPQPDTVLRIFLQYEPLISKPGIIPQPQTLNKVSRNGFTLIEWGGLIK